MAIITTTNPLFVWNRKAFNLAALGMLPDAVAFGPPIVIAAITPNATATTLPLGNTRGLICDVAGSASIVDPFGNTITVYLQAGINWLSVQAVISITTIGHVIGIW